MNRNLVGLAYVALLTSTQVGAVPGGFIENSDDVVTRPVVRQVTVPAGRGPFTFPEPYNTEAVRITIPSDCGGNDCVWSSYGYWRQTNNHVNDDFMYIYVRTDPRVGGAGPAVYRYDKGTDAVTDEGRIFDTGPSELVNALGEGWYFSATRPYDLYVYSTSAKLYRVNVVTGALETVFDASVYHPGISGIVQVHSSDDDRVHSASLRVGSDRIGCFVFDESTGFHDFFPERGNFDECQVDRSGRWLVIKDDFTGFDPGDEDNVIVDLLAGTERIIDDVDGAGGHSDLGHGYMVADDDWGPEPSTKRFWDFEAPVLSGAIVAHGDNSDAWIGMGGHLTHTNARPRSVAAPDEQMVCGSQFHDPADPGNTNARANELLCFLPDESENLLIVAPTIGTMDEPQATLDVTGRYMVWLANNGSARNDLFLVKVPNELLGVSEPPPPTCDPEVETCDPPDPGSGEGGEADVIWTDVLDANVVGNSITENGCDCGDAGGRSSQEIDAGDGYVEFTPGDATTMRGIGLSSGATSYTYGGIDFSIVLWATGNAEFRQDGAYLGDTPYSAGDRFRIAVESGVVNFYKNLGGTLTLLDSVTPTTITYPLHVAAALHQTGSGVDDVVISTDEEEPPPPPPTGGAVTWTNVVNATVSGTTIFDNGCECGNAGAESAQEIVAGDGYVEFTAPEADTMRAVGLNAGAASYTYGGIDFAIVLWANGNAEVRESGVYRGDTPYVAGTRFKISIEDGDVKYYKFVNDAWLLFDTIMSPSVSYPLKVNAALQQTGSTIADAVIEDS